VKRTYSLIFLITAIMIVYYGRIDISRGSFSEIPDIQNYRQMALAAPGFDTTVSRNFGYRILLPYIAGMMPFDVDTNFYIMTVLMSLFVPFVFFFFLRMYGLKEDTSFYLTVLFVAGRHSFGFPVWYFYDVHDLMTHILIPIFLMALKQNNFLIMSALLAIGTINRETVLFLAPASFFYYSFMQKDRVKTLKAVLSVIPAVIVFFVIRSLIVTESGIDSGVAYSLGRIRFDESNKLLDPVTYYRIINTFIPLTLIPLVFWNTTKQFFKKNMHFLVFTATYFASSFLAGDTERLIVPVFPVFFLLLGLIFEKISFYEPRGRIMVLLACLLSIPNHITFRFTLPHRDWKVIISFFTLGFVTAYFYKLKKERKDVLDNNSDI
jgi:hypothetical protein